MEAWIDNSYFHENYSGLNILVIVPHEDDEINTACALIHSLSIQGAKITLAYTTNGDWKYSAKRRIKEALRASSVLNVDENNILFLGYGDSINNNEHNHLYYHNNTIAKSSSGHMETYGTKSNPDFAFQFFGVHHTYTCINYLNDLISLLEHLYPNLIICTDFDEHPDHRMLSLYLDKAIGIIRRKNNAYCPGIWKRFAYALAYTAVSDYSAINNPETQRPTIEDTGKYKWDFIDKFYYQWNHRIRIPIPVEFRERVLKKNIVSKALLMHNSQYIITKADRIINSDEIYWFRRTDSISYSAKVTVSSGNGEALTDFMLYNVKDIDSVVPIFEDYYWQPDQNDDKKTAQFRWDKPVNIECIVLYGALSDDSSIDKISIKLSDGSETIVQNLPSNGNPLFVNLGIHNNISFCELKILSISGKNYGISECEIYSPGKRLEPIKPFCKITINDNFVYEYLVDLRIERIPIDCYTYGDTDTIHLSIAMGKARITDGYVVFNDHEDMVVVRAENNTGSVYDQIVIKRLDYNELCKYQEIDKKNKKYLWRKSIELKIHNMLYILTHYGPIVVMRRLIDNVIRPRMQK